MRQTEKAFIQPRHPLISVVVPVFNGEESLARCIASLQNQTYPNIEILLVNDGSVDDTARIAEELASQDHRIRVFRTENKGQGLARNIGLEHAKGVYIGFADADDFAEHGMYEKMLEHARNSDAEVVQCSFNRVDREGRVFQKRYKPSKEITVVERGVFFRDWVSSGDFSYECCNKLYRADFLDRYRIRFHSNREVCYEDLLFNLEAAYHLNKLVSLSDCYYHYTYAPDSYSQMRNPADSEKILRLFRLFLQQIASDKDELLQYEVKNMALHQLCLMFSGIIRKRDGRLWMKKLMRTESVQDYLNVMDSALSSPRRRHIAKKLRFLPYPFKYLYVYCYFRKQFAWK